MKNIFKKVNFFLNYNRVGKDSYGNRYYQARKFDKNLGLHMRVVDYKGSAELSKVPQMWHAWLRHILKAPPTEEQLRPYPWQQEHRPNFTGTEKAYYPRGHVMRNAVRVKVLSDYNQWELKG